MFRSFMKPRHILAAAAILAGTLLAGPVCRAAWRDGRRPVQRYAGQPVAQRNSGARAVRLTDQRVTLCPSAQPDDGGILDPPGGRLGGDLAQVFLGRGQELLAPAGALGGQERVAAGDQPLARVGRGAGSVAAVNAERDAGFVRGVWSADRALGERALVEQAREGQILLSFPGFGPIAAATIIAAIGSIHNFPSASALKS